MTQPAEPQFICPACNHAQTLPPLPLIDADADPALKRKLLEGKHPTHRCEKCGKLARPNTELVYLDATARLLVWCVPDRDDTRTEPELPDAVRESLDRAASRFTLRRVDSIVELVEKVLIHEEGMDDRLIEALKLVVGSQLTRDGHLLPSPLRFGGRNLKEDGATTLDLVAVTSKGVQALSGPFEEMYEELAARLAGEMIVTRPTAGVFARIGTATAREMLKRAQD